MKEIIELFKLIGDIGWLNASFVLGAAAIIVAIVGRIPKDTDIPFKRSLVLALFGAVLISISVGSFLLANGNEPAPIPTPGGMTPTAYPQPTVEAVTPMPKDAIRPFREHFPVQVGAGFLSSGTFSDGLAPYTEEWLWENEHFDIQVINADTYPNGCDVSRYDTDLAWIGGAPGMELTVNGQVVGAYSIAPNAHGYIFQGRIHLGDTLCAVNFAPSGFHIILGPDLYYHYDSYCYRGHC